MFELRTHTDVLFWKTPINIFDPFTEQTTDQLIEKIIYTRNYIDTLKGKTIQLCLCDLVLANVSNS